MPYALPVSLFSSRIDDTHENQVAIVPADNAAIGPFTALYVGVTGNVTLVPRNTLIPVLYTAVPAGTVLTVSFQGINATGTTAGGLVGLN